MKKAVVIGAGFAGMSAASFLAKEGWEVTVLEKNEGPGGRARQLRARGFTFDMGPSWYWMPDVFDRYFRAFGKDRADYYQLQRLDPSYRVYWEKMQLDVPADYTSFRAAIELIETGASLQLDKFLEEAAYKYEVGINKLVHKPGLSLAEFGDWELAKGVIRLDVFSSMKQHVSKYFKDERLRQLLEFPVLFLGALPEKIPALYSLMNYADIKLGTWYPEGGMYAVVDAMYQLATELGVCFRFNENVTSVEVMDGHAVGVHAANSQDEAGNVFYEAEVVIGAADYHFIETKLLPPQYRSYTQKYWDTRIMAPSCMIFYVGLDKKLKAVQHHSLFFDVDFDKHGRQIYEQPQWPDEPLFYVSATSVTDPTAAPEGGENLFFLVPVAAGLGGDDEMQRKAIFQKIIKRFEQHTNQRISDHIVFERSYSVSDFVRDYNSFKGNAYGLANTLWQTAIFKPSLKSKKVDNLFYTGQLTVPGPGVPPSLISGEVVAKEVVKVFAKHFKKEPA